MRNLSVQNKADIALIVVAVVWGATFLPMANALKTNGVFVMLFCRFFLSAIFMGFVALKFAKKFDKKSVIYGVVLGAVLFFVICHANLRAKVLLLAQASPLSRGLSA